MRLLVTRPEADAQTFARLLGDLGHEAVIAPLMEIRAHEGGEVALDGVQGVLATSANGIRALAARSSRRDVTVYAVGPQTAEAAASAGFVRIHNAAGNAKALVEFAAARADRTAGKLLHAAGEETAGAVRESLIARGFNVETMVFYGAHPVPALPEAAAQAMREATLDGVMLFSPRSASLFAKLVADAGLALRCTGLAAFCISQATAAALAPLTFARVEIAATPDQAAMLALLP